jgi:hypothetical protein
MSDGHAPTPPADTPTLSQSTAANDGGVPNSIPSATNALVFSNAIFIVVSPHGL